MNKEQRKELLDSIEYNIDQIRLVLALDNREIIGSFRGAVRLTQHLYELIRIAAIIEEREEIPTPIIKFP